MAPRLLSPARPRKQWGSDRRTSPPPMLPPVPTDRQVTLGRLSIITTVLAWLAYVVTTVVREFVDHGVQNMRFASEAVSYVVVVTVLTFSALMYLLARQGALYRFRTHARVPRAEIDRFFHGSMPTLTVLVPSYREDPRVVRTTLLSAALQEYPYMRVVLLLDDPPNPADEEARAQLEEGRRVADGIADLLAEPERHFATALESFEASTTAEPTVQDVRVLAQEYGWAVSWLERQAHAESVTDHVDHFFVEQVLRGLATDLDTVRRALTAAADDGSALPRERMLQLYRRLAWTFRASMSTFERRRYASLSQEPNKAMNLNSYIGLMGRSFDEVETPQGLILQPAGSHGTVVVPDPDYVLTLDADSVLLREYCLRLVHFLEQPQNARVAVTQTPYSSFPGSRTRLERIAAATTDIQHILHQGMTHYGATFWVGANAVLRKSALEDIVEVEHVGGFEHRRYIQDRTVIEDTESSVDLGVHGWSLVNYPERLSYSATPPDFGSLLIQRRRWADGGLLIMPKLWRQARERRGRHESGRLPETLLRVNYMGSIAWASFGLVFLLAYPYDSRLLSPLVLGAALPYFLSMASDLRRCGYKRSDVLRIYGFNLILLPVNLAGVLKSLQQAVTGKKIAFARTPKVRDRTTAPLTYVLLPYVIVAFSLLTMSRDIGHANWGNAAFALFNALLAAYAIVAFIGLGNTLVDVWANVVQRLYVTARPRRARAAARATRTGLGVADSPAVASAMDWESVLYYGTADAPALTRLPAPVAEPAPDVAEPHVAAAVSGPVTAMSTMSTMSTQTLLDLVRSVEPTANVELRFDGTELAVKITPRGGPATA